MGKRGTCPPPVEMLLSFCASVVARRSVGELFMHYFHNQSSAYGGLTPPWIHPWTPLGAFVPTPNLSTPGKNPAGAHAVLSPSFSSFFLYSSFLPRRFLPVFPSLPYLCVPYLGIPSWDPARESGEHCELFQWARTELAQQTVSGAFWVGKSHSDDGAIAYVFK